MYGSYIFDHPLADLLRLRIYTIDYFEDHRPDRPFPKLNIVARGVPDDARGHCKHLDIFDLYWLEGPLREEKK